MTIHCLLLNASSLPEGDDWLGAEERRVLAGLMFPKRRSDWRLGRFTAKRVLTSLTNVEPLDRIQIIAAEDGAPEVTIDGESFPSSVSISHRDGLAACLVAAGMRVGCDLELVEPRSSRFVADYFTSSEQVALDEVPVGLRDRQVALTWSAKESALKALRVGLRRDTRSVEVELAKVGPGANDWSPLRVTAAAERRSFRGWWRQEGNWVLTVVCDDETAKPPSGLRVARHDEER